MPTKQGTRNRTHISKSEAKLQRAQNGRTVNVHKDVHSSETTKGFNIAKHVNGNMDHSSGSLSPDTDQFLQDITSLVTPLLPDSSRPELEKESGAASLMEDGTTVNNTERMLPKLASKAQRPKLHIAANFAIDASKQQTVPSLNLGSESQELTPANQETSQTSSLKASNPKTNSLVSQTDLNTAATRIQRWYRDMRDRQQQARVQSLLRDKRDELNQSKVDELKKIQLQVEDREAKEVERQKRRETKMQAARKAAIESLQKKREEKRQEAERIAQEEIVSQ